MVFVAYSDLTALNNLQPAIPQRFLRSFAVRAPVFLFGSGLGGGGGVCVFSRMLLSQCFKTDIFGPTYRACVALWLCFLE